jgi:hypothetical protein
MFERFTDRARRVLVVAQEEAKGLDHAFIGPDHILLGLVQGDGVAAVALGQLGVTLEPLRAKVFARSSRVAPGTQRSKVPFSPEAKKSLEMSLREALRLGHNYIGTEHLLLGVVRADTDGMASELLGVGADEVRRGVIALLPGAATDSLQSRAVTDALGRARQLAGTGPMTTGHLLRAVLTDGESQAAKALARGGVGPGSIDAYLGEIPVETTSDAPPRPRAVEITLGTSTTTIDDPDLAAALDALSADQLRAALRAAIERPKGSADGGSADGGS